MNGRSREAARVAGPAAFLPAQAAVEYIELTGVMARATALARDVGDWALGNWPLIALLVIVALVTVGRVGR